MEGTELRRKKLIFFHEFADATLRFNDGSTIQVDQSTLSIKSRVFHKLFIESPEKIVNIKEYDLVTFRLFLNCLMKFQECSITDALLIFPIAWQFETKKLVQKCIQILEPCTLNENLCLALNISIFCSCDELYNKIMDFLAKNQFFNKLLDNEELYFLLEPEAIEKCLSNIHMDSHTFNNVFKWGEHYLKKNQKPVELKPFFEEYGIAKYLTLSSFETLPLFLEFDESDLGKNFFTYEDLREYIKNNEIDQRKAAWFVLKAGKVLVERFTIKKVTCYEEFITDCTFYTNPIVPYGAFEKNLMDRYYTFKFSDLPHYIDYERGFSFRVHPTGKGITACNIWKIDRKMNIMFDLEVEVKYTPKVDCRILKTSAKNFLPVYGEYDDLFFTDVVEVDHSEKKGGKNTI